MLLFFVVLLIILILLLRKVNENYFILALCERIKCVEGKPLEEKVCIIPGKTIFGNNFDAVNVTPGKLFKLARSFTKLSKGRSYVLNFLIGPVYNIINAEDAEQLFQSQSLTTKGFMYDFLQPFLGDGLLRSSEEKWHLRRKMLTPAFHFNILQTFNEIFKEESLKLLEKLKHLQHEDVNISDVIDEFSLNNVCETALGVKLNDIDGASEYRAAVHNLSTMIVRRVCNPLMYYRIIFYLFGQYSETKHYAEIIHNFSGKIISKKRKKFLQEDNGCKFDKENSYVKTRYAMLDTLLHNEAQGLIDHQGICEEVDTVMFEGYDTTSTCLKFALLNLAQYPDIQKRCYQEIENLTAFENLTVFDFNKVEYLGCVIKETLRMHPSVPIIQRLCTKETVLNGLILPTNAQVNIHINDIMRDSKHFPEPSVFKPERFLPENTHNMHPFAFVPFSAGSRNCIGQKFAMLEIKAALVAILRAYRVLPVIQTKELILEYGITLRTKQKLFVKFEPRVI
ncbi:probable cytochrome P450 4ac1 [Glossina fuscipes]|uniref:Probable cytochrome P450 4ac1 n=1 Tax=Glossina fuscipes TaxID=7396 RepID=A0A9C5ZH56_9MUSC|nr:probable cytochrome P450 4ac1 [Glossina fuscipes]